MTNNHISSPGLRIRSPSKSKAKSTIAISRGDDDSSIDDDRRINNNKMCISDETTIKCVFNKKRLFGGSAFAFVAVVVIMAVAIATTRSDDGSSNSMATIGGNSNSAVGTADIGSATAAASPKVTPVAPTESNFAFVAPKSVAGGAKDPVERCNVTGHSGKSGKSGSYCYSGKSGKSGGHGLIDLSGGYGSSWHGSGKSGKSGSSYFPPQTCDAKSPSGKSGKSGSNQLWRDIYRFGPSDAWYSSGKSGKSGAGYCTLSPENKQNNERTCVSDRSEDINAGCWLDPEGGTESNIGKVEKIELDQPICGSLSVYGDVDVEISDQDFDVYKFDVICPGKHTVILRSTGPEQPLFDEEFGDPFIEPYVYGPGSTCQPIDFDAVFTKPFGGIFGDVCDASVENTVYVDETTFAFTLDIQECGSYLFEVVSYFRDGFLPTCEEKDINCGLGGDFLYSVEVKEGAIKGNDDGAKFLDDEC